MKIPGSFAIEATSCGTLKIGLARQGRDAIIWRQGLGDRSQHLLMVALADCANEKWLTIARRSHERHGNTYQLSMERLRSHDRESRDNLSQDKMSTHEVTKRTKPPDSLKGRTVKNHQEPSEGAGRTTEKTTPVSQPGPSPRNPGTMTCGFMETGRSKSKSRRKSAG